MSWFWGHLLPGLGWILMGLFHWFQSMQGVSFFKPLRTQPMWIAARSIAVMVFCFLGVMGELIGELNSNWGVNNYQHLIIWGGFFTGGLVEFLHIYNVLSDPFWAIIPPVGVCYVGIMLSVHEQLRVFWRYLHLVSGLTTLPAVLILMYIPLRAMKNYRKKVERNQVRTEKPFSQAGNCFWRGRTIDDINPVYTDLSIYFTVWPGLVAFFFTLEGFLWLEMTFRMGWWSSQVLPPEIPHPEHAFLAMFIGDIVMVLALFAVTSRIARWMDRVYYGGNGTSRVDLELV
eukprot:TRINITY_DN1723_c0_g1_i3.p1 TRINITY_DN1723_c0_g1~~TRINITY_DN1723_c0_g1_i3.p1  ORF type:complete len:287 (-),score=50.88 TRINITY_DN1723_c0_g1_i3:127-987(-)